MVLLWFWVGCLGFFSFFWFSHWFCSGLDVCAHVFPIPLASPASVGGGVYEYSCQHVYMYIHVLIGVCAYAYACIYVYVYVYMCVCVYVCMCVCVYMCMCVHAYGHAYVCAYMCVDVHVYLQIDRYIDI